MTWALALVSLTFWGLVAHAWRERRFAARTRAEWTLDLTSLLAQGVLVPIVPIALVHFGLAALWPAGRGALDLPGWAAFLTSFTLVDYAYYWAHRGLHGRRGWSHHRVHHSLAELDVLGTSRNSAWTPLLLPYLWAQTLFIFVLPDPTAFLLGAAASQALDLWRHSGLRTPRPLARVLGPVFILPEDHEWHHSRARSGVNFGANLNLWDRLHRTFYRGPGRATTLGSPAGASTRTQLFAPWRIPP